MGQIDLTDVVSVTRALVDIDSTTGREGDCVLWMATLLSESGYGVIEQVVEGRDGMYAAFGKADVVLSTHLDCVPPFFPSRVDGDTLFGRGSCDAKGAAASQVAAAETLRRQGTTNVGLLFVVGEERGSDGAKTAQMRRRVQVLNHGEPTDTFGRRHSRARAPQAKVPFSSILIPELGDPQSRNSRRADHRVKLRADRCAVGTTLTPWTESWSVRRRIPAEHKHK